MAFCWYLGRKWKKMGKKKKNGIDDVLRGCFSAVTKMVRKNKAKRTCLVIVGLHGCMLADENKRSNL